MAVILAIFSIRVVYEYEKAIVFQLGKYSRTLEPGLRFIIPLIERSEKVDMRLRVQDVPSQDTITKDNISVRVDAVLYFKITNAEESVIEVRDFQRVTGQLAQTTMRNVVGEVTLDQLLTEREQISERIRVIVDKATDPWGVKIDGVELKHVELPEDMKRVMAKAAEAEREKRSVIIKASGELEAAKKLAQAAKELNAVPGGLHIRMLQTINKLGGEKSITKTFTTPSEVLDALMQSVKKR